MKLKKGSIEAKRFMAKIRAMKSGTKKKATKKKATKKIGATKFFEAELETKSSKPKRNISVTRNGNGTFKKFNDKILEARRLRAKLRAKKNKSKISGIHKDTKSHNVKINVMSGDKNVLLNLAKERDSLIFVIGKIERNINYLRGDLKWIGKSKSYEAEIKHKKYDIKRGLDDLKELKPQLKKINSLIQKELKRK